MDKIIKYLRLSIDEKAEIRKWNAKENLNLQLAGSYEYYLVSVLGDTFLLIKPLEDFSISKIMIHINRISEFN